MSENKPVFTKEHFNDLDFVRGLVLDKMREDPSASYTSNMDCGVDYENPMLDRQKFAELQREVMWKLAVDGIIVPHGSNGVVTIFGHCNVSKHGQEVLKERRFNPYDPTGYMEEVKKAKTIVCEVAEGYVAEALECYNSRCFVAAVLLLGVGAEAVFWNLKKEVVESLKKKENVKDPGNRMKDAQRWVVAKYDTHRAKIENLLPDSIDQTLRSLGDLIRRQRNDLGHPKLGRCSVDREKAFMFFRLFATYVQDLEEFVQYIQEHGFNEPVGNRGEG